MPKVRYINADGFEQAIDVEVGVSVMQAAVAHDIEGIVGECGGNMMCATCHVYVEPAQSDLLPEMLEFEDMMLEETISPRESNSRLSCQLVMDEHLDGLIVHTPEAQI